MEMVTLLPNASKRDALLLAHNHYHSKEFGKPARDPPFRDLPPPYPKERGKESNRRSNARRREN